MSTPVAEIDELRGRIGKVGLWLSALGSESAAVEREAVLEIEELGYSALWIGESPRNKESFAHAGLLLAASSKLVVATGIASIYGRDALGMRTGGEALADAYPGRFVLGMGVSHAPLVTIRGHEYGKPLTAMREYLDAMQTAEYYPPAPEIPLPVVLAALRPKMLELARDRTAGAHPYFVPVEHTRVARETLGAGPLLAPEQAVILETDPERARTVARTFMSLYLALPNYVNNLRELDYEDADFVDGGSDRLVDDIVAWGDADAVQARVAAHLDAGADHVSLQPLGGGIAGAMAQVRELAPAVL